VQTPSVGTAQITVSKMEWHKYPEKLWTTDQQESDEDSLWEEWAYLGTAAHARVCELSSKWTVLQGYSDAVVPALFPVIRDIRMQWFSSAGQENKWEYSP
jgi:hypothetical protein